MPARKALLLSIKPHYAAAIFDGRKEYEFRRCCPTIPSVQFCLFYESAPVSQLTGFARVEEIVRASEVDLVQLPGASDPFRDQYHSYLRGAKRPGAIRLSAPVRFDRSMSLTKMFSDLNRPPQSYCYVFEPNQGELARL